MTAAQGIWWRQAACDHRLLLFLVNRDDIKSCHKLLVLQMATEKLAKAYSWGGGKPPGLSHKGFVHFLKTLASRSDAGEVARVLGLGHQQGLVNWVATATPLAHELERLAPALANDGPNPEYPWPHAAPENAPVTHDFDLWRRLVHTGRGRKFLDIVAAAVARFPEYA